MRHQPFTTIIVCTFNGGARISDCMDSLVRQDYDKDSYEVLVVNDGSTDNTPEVIARYPAVRLITHKKNMGVCAARNTGLQNASGGIIAYTDDDCIADAKWLSNLMKHHGSGVMAVGGITVPYSLDVLMEKYMAETGYGNPAPIEFGKSKNPLYRFFVYLKDMFSPLIVSGTDPLPVRSIYTLNASYVKEFLVKAGGWLPGFDFREDAEMCDRLNRLFPTEKILYTKKAVITHKHRTSFFHFLKQTYFRSESTARCYIEDRKIPPVFPFPVFTLLVSAWFFFIDPLAGIISFVLLPQILYFWWLIRYMRQGKGFYLLFPYMQSALELAATLGMLRGLIKFKIKK
jgi:glycosyltransferase involved in cell wall biosynthesis